ncbi:predicted protein [Uncinocarpus reesii 1704]|uniref:Protein kinase domain-containing protein n=1 Tax=Uncinocarpus reesii (strain UAMH 1704) TaxID=336963 RepID=C4JT26_UNCRE|nr:uncharacterized protein UREG_05615 [Uncinocarpus reesii 1704]EEP80773.1 predicted protein [Uncinocarpus reesii 1704]
MNALWGSTLPEGLSIVDKYRILGRPQRKLIPYNTWKPGELVAPIKVPISFCSEKFYLADFGTALQIGSLAVSDAPIVIPPQEYCSPERLHGATPHYSCDMWSYMCVFSDLYFGGPLFRCFNDVVACLGPVSADLKGKYLWPKFSEDRWYDQNTTATGLEDRLQLHQPKVSSTEMKLLLSVLKRGFALEPKHRLTADQLLQNPDFNTLINLYCG